MGELKKTWRNFSQCALNSFLYSVPMSSHMTKVISRSIGTCSHTGRTFIYRIGFKKKELRTVLFLSPPSSFSRNSLYRCQVWKEWKHSKPFYLEEHSALWVLKTWKKLLGNMLFWDHSRCYSIGQKLSLSLLHFMSHAGKGTYSQNQPQPLLVASDTLKDAWSGVCVCHQCIQSSCFVGNLGCPFSLF